MSCGASEHSGVRLDSGLAQMLASDMPPAVSSIMQACVTPSDYNAQLEPFRTAGAGCTDVSLPVETVRLEPGGQCQSCRL